MNYLELREKANRLIAEGKSEQEVVELLRGDIAQAVKHAMDHPEDIAPLMKELNRNGNSVMGQFLSKVLDKSPWGGKRK